MARDYPVLIGACGWHHPAWQGEYYPDDLPAAWQPVYYANEFPVVLIPASGLAAADETALAEWREAGETGLRVVAELDAAGTLATRARQLGDTLAGLLLPAADPATLVTRLTDLGTDLPVVVDFGAGANAVQTDWLSGHDIGWCWRGEGDAGGLAHGELAVVRVPSAGAEPRGLRHCLETALAVQDGRRTVAVIFEGSPPDVAVLRQAQTLCELL